MRCKAKPMIVERPLAVLFQEPQTNNIVCHIHPPEGWGTSHYGLLVCDFVRHLSRCLGCDEDEIWEWVERERRHPTSEIREPS
jgi:hypothetical protein